ncbi:hypothetical protein [Ralstonia insidiosa]|uniref:Uncharacterized protein n=1 Tax=Ralstonia insidiosa TaxID=190721 RepID=A0A848NXS9_9RALS|nr:hypothetical protein [Ralstonia insidiosa]NMV39862.1 hypothetical protein [Ralstonia insidiosa]
MQIPGFFEITILRDNSDPHQRAPRQAIFNALDFTGAISLESGHASEPGARTRVVLRQPCDELMLVDTYNDTLHMIRTVDVQEGFEEVTRRVALARDRMVRPA